MNPALSQDKRYEMMSSRDMAYIAVVFATGRRCDDVAMANLLISQMVPGWIHRRGIMFGFQFGKTLRDRSRI